MVFRLVVKHIVCLSHCLLGVDVEFLVVVVAYQGVVSLERVVCVLVQDFQGVVDTTDHRSSLRDVLDLAESLVDVTILDVAVVASAQEWQLRIADRPIVSARTARLSSFVLVY